MGLRRTDVFGADVDVFRPERWVDCSHEDLRKMQRVVDQTFGWGRYRCAGRIIAWVELNKIFVEVSLASVGRGLVMMTTDLSTDMIVCVCVQLFREFDFQLLNPAKPWTDECFNSFMTKDMWMRVSSREI